jgi:serine/threonine protein kinase
MGEIKLVEHKHTGVQCAAKIIKKANKSEKELELQRREIEALKMCQHTNLIQLLDYFEDNRFFYIILEYLKGGDMYDYLNRREFSISQDRALELSS